MKKLKRIAVSALLISAVFLGGCGGGGAVPEQRIILSDIDGTVFFDSDNNTGQTEDSAFTDIVLDELSRIDIKNTGGQLNVKTSFNAELQQLCTEAYNESRLTRIPFAAVICSVDGKILCAFSGGDENRNYATEKTQPYSAFKPLSVYGPALESGTISWADSFEDSPFKQIENEDGIKEDWPVNGNGFYTYEKTSVRDSIKYSLNTTAVRCLKETGVSFCMDFLSDNFGIDVNFEREQAAIHGEDEVLHNIALGYLKGGVSPVDMAGYYRIFATGGKYTEPYSVLEISDENGKLLYKAQAEEKTIISEETAYIMNALLQSPFEKGGTAETVHVKNAELRGKTGTGTDYAGNWFVCFSPQYVFSIWHGRYTKNNCTEIFSDIADNIDFDSTKIFPECESVSLRVYCEESGCGFTTACPSMTNGYFAEDTVLEKCTLHK